MEIKDFAKMISGREYTYPQFTKQELLAAKENGFVIVYGVSDDLMEIDGAITDEADVWDGVLSGLHGVRKHFEHITK